MIIPVILALMLAHPEPSTPQANEQWWTIDFWEMGIGQPSCEDEPSDGPACRVEEVDQGVIDRLHAQAVALGEQGMDYHYTLEGEVLTLFSLAEPRNSFVCCDIQGPFEGYQTSSGQSLSIAQFVLPEGAFIELMLLNDVTLHGNARISASTSPFLTAYLERDTDLGRFEVDTLDIDGFDRGVHVYRHQPDERPHFVVYMKDGLAFTYIATLQSYYGDQFEALPPFAFVGVESGDVQARNDEYLPGRPGAAEAYVNYRSAFATRIVPEVEARLQYEGGAAGRILTGRSSGGKWVLDYGLDHPGFASSVIAMSPAGRDLEALPAPDPDHGRQTYYLSVGRIETQSFVDSARQARDLLADRGIKVHYQETAGGHSDSSWSPFFVEAFEQITGVRRELEP